MITSLLPFKVLILLLAAILVWIGLISLAFLALSGVAFSSGWIVAGALISSAVAWVLVMIREIRDSVRMPDDFDNGEPLRTDTSRFDRRMGSGTSASTGTRMSSEWRNSVKARGPQGQPRKVRSFRKVRPEHSSQPEFFHPDV